MSRDQTNRDAALRRLRRTNLAMAAGSVIGAGGIMTVIAATAKAEHRRTSLSQAVQSVAGRAVQPAPGRWPSSPARATRRLAPAAPPAAPSPPAVAPATPAAAAPAGTASVSPASSSASSASYGSASSPSSVTPVSSGAS